MYCSHARNKLGTDGQRRRRDQITRVPTKKVSTRAWMDNISHDGELIHLIVTNTTSRPGSTISSSTTLDLEAQKCDSCRPRLTTQEAEAEAKQGRFKPSPRMISDAIIGLSDGLTVPFALTAGLSSLGNARLVVLGGLAELIAGAISMGLGGFIGAKSEA